MDAGRNPLLSNLERIVTTAHHRQAALEEVAALIRSSANYRWVGLYDIDPAAGLVRNVTWSGPGAPEHPTFPLTKGPTSAAVAEKQSVNVGDVSADPRYLTAFGTTRSEIIVPVFDAEGKSVVGTIDVESEEPNAFNKAIQDLLEACSAAFVPSGKSLRRKLSARRGRIHGPLARAARYVPKSLRENLVSEPSPEGTADIQSCPN
jgi:L-methionine (R)-S-oxide reductase